MNEAVVDFAEVQSLIAPAFSGQTVRVVWSDDTATVTVIREKRARKLKAYGSLAALSDSNISRDGTAWSEAAVKKFADSRR